MGKFDDMRVHNIGNSHTEETKAKKFSLTVDEKYKILSKLQFRVYVDDKEKDVDYEALQFLMARDPLILCNLQTIAPLGVVVKIANHVVDYYVPLPETFQSNQPQYVSVRDFKTGDLLENLLVPAINESVYDEDESIGFIEQVAYSQGIEEEQIAEPWTKQRLLELVNFAKGVDGDSEDILGLFMATDTRTPREQMADDVEAAYEGFFERLVRKQFEARLQRNTKTFDMEAAWKKFLKDFINNEKSN